MIELAAVPSNHLRTEILDLTSALKGMIFPATPSSVGIVLGKAFGWVCSRLLLPTCDAWADGQGNYVILIKGNVMYEQGNPNKVRKDIKTGRMLWVWS